MLNYLLKMFTLFKRIEILQKTLEFYKKFILIVNCIYNYDAFFLPDVYKMGLHLGYKAQILLCLCLQQITTKYKSSFDLNLIFPKIKCIYNYDAHCIWFFNLTFKEFLT